MKKQTITKLIAAIITITLVAILLSQISTRNIMDMLVNTKPRYLMLGFGLYAITYFLRALRFHILLKREVGLKDLFSIVSIHNMALNIFPARSGELSYIYLLKKRHDRNVGEGVATLITTRMFDIISISILFFASTMMIHDQPDIMIKSIPIVSVLLFLFVLILLIFMYQCSRLVDWLRNVSAYLKFNEFQFIKYIFKKLDEVALSFESIHRNEFILSLLISVMIWMSLYSVNYFLVIAMGINLPLDAVFLASTFFFMISILPIQGIGGFGTLEGSWAISFIVVGVTKQAAISSGFLMHIFSIFCLFILFLFGFAWQHKKL